MAEYFIKLAIIFCVAASVSSQELFPGRCPNVPIVQNFQSKNYSGMWYEIEHYWFAPELLGTCVRVEYRDNGDDATFEAIIRQQVIGTNKQWNNPGHTKFLSNDRSGFFLLEVLVTQSPVPFVAPYPYMVLDTDYVNYTIKYLCKNIGFHHLKTMWILARKKYLEKEILAQIHHNLRSWGIDTRRLIKSDTSTCPE